MEKQIVQKIYQEYLFQAITNFSNVKNVHENEYDDSGGDPDYHNNTHDNTPGFYCSLSEINSYQTVDRKIQLLKIYLKELSLKNEYNIDSDIEENERVKGRQLRL